jgi:hypothetical protein
MTQPLPDSLAAIQAAYAQAQAGAPAAPPPPAQSFAPPPAPVQVPPGMYQASDGRFYPLAAQPQPQPAPAPVAAPAPAPAAPQAAPALAPSGFSVPPQQAVALAAQHAAQPLPINPPEAQQALLPEVQAALPAERKKRGRKASAPAANAGATEGESSGSDLASASTDLLVEVLTERGYIVRLEKAAQL